MRQALPETLIANGSIHGQFSMRTISNEKLSVATGNSSRQPRSLTSRSTYSLRAKTKRQAANKQRIAQANGHFLIYLRRSLRSFASEWCPAYLRPSKYNNAVKEAPSHWPTVHIVAKPNNPGSTACQTTGHLFAAGIRQVLTPTRQTVEQGELLKSSQPSTKSTLVLNAVSL